MEKYVLNYNLAFPEMVVLAMTSVILLSDLFFSQKQRVITYSLAQATLLAAAILILMTYQQEPMLAFSDTYIRDGKGDILKLFILLSGVLVFLYSKPHLISINLFKGEYYILGLFAILGMMVMVSAHSLLTIYLGLELLALSLYVLVALQRDSVKASESAMKYFVLGALASAMLLYGMSMLYGATGTLELSQISDKIATTNSDLVTIFGLVFIIVGVAFKLGIVPFHMWVPDVYEGAPTSVTLFIASAPKIAAFAMVYRLLVDGLSGLHIQWQDMLIILSVLSMGLGNIFAIAQTNIKRMFAYSTIAHMGYFLLGILSGNNDGYAASMFYTISYTLMTLAGFGMVIMLSRTGDDVQDIVAFKGLNERSPWYAGMMLIIMFSMAGVPPFLGFWAKVSVLKELIHVELTWLAAVAVVFSIIGAFYYLRIIKLMYFDKAENLSPLGHGYDFRLVLSLNSLGILILGVLPGPLLSICAVSISG